jgi:hypothetical protein
MILRFLSLRSYLPEHLLIQNNLFMRRMHPAWNAFGPGRSLNQSMASLQIDFGSFVPCY